MLRNRKIVLQSKDGHALWVSPAILASIHSDGELLADIEGGVLTRTVDGHPAGWLPITSKGQNPHLIPGVFIDKAQDIVPRDELNDNDLRRRFLAAVHDGHSKGLTSIHDAGEWKWKIHTNFSSKLPVGFSPVSLDFFKR
jgi:predicted amidohydrolase YtcJ